MYGNLPCLVRDATLLLSAATTFYFQGNPIIATARSYEHPVRGGTVSIAWGCRRSTHGLIGKQGTQRLSRCAGSHYAELRRRQSGASVRQKPGVYATSCGALSGLAPLWHIDGDPPVLAMRRRRVDREHDARVWMDPPGHGIEAGDDGRRMILERLPTTLGVVVTVDIKMHFHAKDPFVSPATRRT